MTEIDKDRWQVEYYSHTTKAMSTAMLEIPDGLEVEEGMTFPGVDDATGEAVQVRCEGGEWATVPEFELVYLGVSCDAPGELGCTAYSSGDFKVRSAADRAARLGYVLDHAAREGWAVVGRENPLTAQTFCPDHKGVDVSHWPEAGLLSDVPDAFRRS
jgi:hypothetical protein